MTFDYRGLTVCKTGPWGQGPVFLQQLALLDGFDLEAMGCGSADYIHTVVECAKLAFADREAWYGDPRDAPVPLAELLSPGYTAERRGAGGPRQRPATLRPGRARRRRAAAALVRDRRVRPAGRPGGPGLRPRRPTGATARGAADGRRTCPPRSSGRGTPVTSTSRTGSATWCPRRRAAAGCRARRSFPGSGFCLGTRAQMFALTPGLASTLAPRRRPRTTLTPSLALRDGEPYLAFGTPGGDQQDQWTLAVLPQPRGVRDEPAGGHRRARVPHRAFPVVVLPA